MDTDTTEYSVLFTLDPEATWRACHHGFFCEFSFVCFLLA